MELIKNLKYAQAGDILVAQNTRKELRNTELKGEEENKQREDEKQLKPQELQ